MSRRGPIQEQSTVSATILRIADALCVIASSLAAFIWRHGYVAVPVHYQVATIMGVLLTLIVFINTDVYLVWRGKSLRHHAHALALRTHATRRHIGFVRSRDLGPGERFLFPDDEP